MRRETQGFPGNKGGAEHCSIAAAGLSYGESQVPMNTSRLPQWIYALLLACGAIGAAHYYALLPERMASHFSSDGTPNGWQLKEMFFALMAMVTASTAIIGFLAPVLIARRPASQINLPNKEYWLAPERRAVTMEFIAGQMRWFACAVLFVLLFGGYEALRANLRSVVRFDSQAMLVVLVGFLAFVLLWLIGFVRHFSRVD
jgi:uncharacterized membrane protein